MKLTDSQRTGWMICSLCFLCFLMQLSAEPMESEEILLRKLKSSDAAIRRAAAEGLAQIEHKDLKKILPALLIAIKDQEADVRFYAAVTLTAAAYTDEQSARTLNEAVPVLIKTLNDKDARVREYVANALALVMPESPAEAAEPLVKLLNDKEKGAEKTVQEAVLAALSRIKPATPEMISAVLKLLKEDKSVKGQAASALGDFGSSDPEVISALVDAMKDSDRFVRQEAVCALRKTGRPARGAIPELKKIADNPKEDQSMRDNAVAALRKIE